MGPARHSKLGGRTAAATGPPSKTHLRGPRRKGKAWVPRIPSPGPVGHAPISFLGEVCSGPSVLSVRSEQTRPCTVQGGRHPVPDLRPHRGPVAHGVCPVAARLASPSAGSPPPPWSWPSAMHPAQSSVSSVSSRPPPPRALHRPRPQLGHSRLRARVPAWAHAAHARSHRHSPALTVRVLRGFRRYRRSRLRPGARSAGPARALKDPEPGGLGEHPHAGHAPRDRERTPERQEGPGGAPGGCPGYGACAEPSPSQGP